MYLFFFTVFTFLHGRYLTNQSIVFNLSSLVLLIFHYWIDCILYVIHCETRYQGDSLTMVYKVIGKCSVCVPHYLAKFAADVSLLPENHSIERKTVKVSVVCVLQERGVI